MRQSNAEMFESKAMTHDKIQNGEYLEFLESHGPRLADWKARFERMDGMSDRPCYCAVLTIAVPPLSRTLLMIEFEYTRKAMYQQYVDSLLIISRHICQFPITASSAGGMCHIRRGFDC